MGVFNDDTDDAYLDPEEDEVVQPAPKPKNSKEPKKSSPKRFNVPLPAKVAGGIVGFLVVAVIAKKAVAGGGEKTAPVTTPPTVAVSTTPPVLGAETVPTTAPSTTVPVSITTTPPVVSNVEASQTSKGIRLAGGTPESGSWSFDLPDGVRKNGGLYTSKIHGVEVVVTTEQAPVGDPAEWVRAAAVPETGKQTGVNHVDVTEGALPGQPSYDTTIYQQNYTTHRRVASAWGTKITVTVTGPTGNDAALLVAFTKVTGSMAWVAPVVTSTTQP